MFLIYELFTLQNYILTQYIESCFLEMSVVYDWLNFCSTYDFSLNSYNVFNKASATLCGFKRK